MTEQQITAYDLGEDGEQWMVEGTLDPDAARGAVLALWVEQGVATEYAEQVSGKAEMSYAPKESWWWATVDEDGTEHDPWLRGFAADDPAPEGVAAFSGVLVQL